MFQQQYFLNILGARANFPSAVLHVLLWENETGLFSSIFQVGTVYCEQKIKTNFNSTKKMAFK